MSPIRERYVELVRLNRSRGRRHGRSVQLCQKSINIHTHTVILLDKPSQEKKSPISLFSRIAVPFSAQAVPQSHPAKKQKIFAAKGVS